MAAFFRLLLFVGVAAVLSAAEPALSVTAAGKTLAFTAAEFAALPRTTITARETHTQKEHRYAGVTARELLVRAGAPLGEKLRGAALRLGVIVRCRDGYAVAFALADTRWRFPVRDPRPNSESKTPPPPRCMPRSFRIDWKSKSLKISS